MLHEILLLITARMSTSPVLMPDFFSKVLAHKRSGQAEAVAAEL
jgi:hypothetical protein